MRESPLARWRARTPARSARAVRWNRYPLRDYERLDRYVAERYQHLADVSRVRIYRRRDCAARQSQHAPG